MYGAKENGRNAYMLYNVNNPAPRPGRLSRESQLREAIKNRELALYYQPLFTLAPLRLKGFEALVRWQDPNLGLISPSEFIPMAEEAGLIHELSRWVLAEAASRPCNGKSSTASTLPISVNLSAPTSSASTSWTRLQYAERAQGAAGPHHPGAHGERAAARP